MFRHLLRGFAVFSLLHPLVAAPVISEFMADNESTIRDEDGDFSDWIEIHNPTAEALPLNQWCLTDSATNPTKWRFPDMELAPGEFLVVWASNKNRRTPGAPLHANFALSKDGEYLALVRPDGTAGQAFAPAFPPQRADESFGARFDSVTLLERGETVRFRAPDGAGNPTADWREAAYDDGSWSSGPSGLGHGMTVPGITVRQVFKNVALNGELSGGLPDANALLALPDGHPGILSSTTATVPVVNFLGEGSDGRFGGNLSPPGGAGDDYAIQATGFVEIATAGTYTFGLNSDDGGSIHINGSPVMIDNSYHGPQDHFGNVFLEAGLHSFVVVMFERGGGDCVEFFAAPGHHTTWNASLFRLVGDTANGGLPATTLPSGSGGVIATNTQAALSGKAGAYFRAPFAAPGEGIGALSLVMRHNDGFAAWLNGTPAAADNAPAAPEWNSTAFGERANSDSLRRKGFNLIPYLSALNGGTNVLAIHGMKASVADTSFLVLPEIIAGSLEPGEPFAFYGGGRATPGWINGDPSSLGKVADTSFSVKRGFYTAPVEVAISTATPGATIRYTTDGSTPTESHGDVYSGPLTISSTTVLRARAVMEDWEPTNVDTQTYFFVDDIILQSPDGAPPPGWPASSGTAQVLDYGMDPDIVNHSNPQIGGPEVAKSALLALPAVSLVTDLPNLFNIDGSQGIYSNPHGRGFPWERPVSVEWILPPDSENPNGRGEFQIDAGLRMRGGFSRSTDNPKHSWRLFFRGDYGETKLRYPLFGRHGAAEFDKIDLRTSQNYSWSFGGDNNNTFMREEATRVAQLDMGQPGSRVVYIHVFVNGQYWGLHNLDERTEADYAEAYFGGDKEDYDTVKAEQDSGYTTGAVDGDLAAFQELWNQSKEVRASPADNAAYFRMMGLAADGATPAADPVLLDVDNLIDYMLLTFWTGNLDGCTSAFLGNDRANNWSGIRRRDGNPGQGFRFFVHDFEHSFFNLNEDRTGPFHDPPSGNESSFSHANPYFFHRDLIGNAEYRMRWADRIHRHLFNDGVLTSAAWHERMNKLAEIVDASIVAESARWGDAKSASPKTRLTWRSARDSLFGYLTPRGPIVLNQLRADGLYPALDAPSLSPFGGYQDSGVEVVVGGPAGATYYYMPDGSDPRSPGGALKPGALTHIVTGGTETLIPWSGADWKYEANGLNLGTAWREPGFDDSGWPSGPAELGYGDGDEATVIPIVFASPGQKVATCYFRRYFDVSNPDEITSLTVQVKYDDACAVYLNGTRIAGTLPIDPAYNYYSGNAIEDTILEAPVPPGLLQPGVNLIAVEVHQANGGSSDLSMNFSLTGHRSSTSTPLYLTGSGERVFRMRAASGPAWSALTEATYLLDTEPASSANLAISEIMYHPADPSAGEEAAGFTDKNEFEFIELLNIGTRHVDLHDVYFHGAIDFDFTGAATGRTLAPGARVLVVANKAAFELRYGPGKPVAGQYSGKLDNAGEHIFLVTPDGGPIRDVDYSDDPPWPAEADGAGFSLVRRFPGDAAGDSVASGWRASTAPGGSPGEEDTPPPGSYDGWRIAAFEAHERYYAAVSGESADPDGDGRNNFEEFALATDPLLRDRPEVFFTWSENSGSAHAALRFLRPEAVTGVLYELLACDNLEDWQPVETSVATATPLGDGIESAVIRDPFPATAPKRFLRLRVTPQP